VTSRTRFLSAVALSALALTALPGAARAGLSVPPLEVDLVICLPPLPLPADLLRCPQPPPPAPTTEPPPTAATPGQVRYDPRRIIVDLKGRPSPDAVERLWKRAGVSRERTLRKVGLYVVRAPEDRRDEAIASLAKSRLVEDVDRELVLHGLDTTPRDPDWPNQWGLRLAGFPAAWDVTRGSKSIVVAVLDTGVDSSNPELKDALVPGRNVVDGDADTRDENGHGTAVAGVLAARTNNGAGVAGACWSCSVMPIKVLGADGSGTTADVGAGIIWAADHGARVINMSLGAPGTTQALSDAVSYALAKDVVIVASAGNSGAATPFYPAAAPNVIGVAATNESDRLYSWSNRGSWVQVAAPGCNEAPWLEQGYIGFCGTSAAAPLVSGLAALIRSAWPQASAAQTAAAVVASVDSVAGEIGGGRINAARALSRFRPVVTTTRRKKTFEGRLGKRIRARTHEEVIGSGPLTAVLTFRGARRLALVLRQPGRGAIRVSGRSPLRVSRSMVSGPLTAVVQSTNSTRTTYHLTIVSAARATSARE
jgi:subtilisin family serine protease